MATGGGNEPEWGVAPPGYRLPAATHIGAVRLQVADLDRSVGYYQSVIGLRLIDRSAGVARLGAHDGTTALVELHERPGVMPVPRRGLLGLYHFAILVPDRASLGRFVRDLHGQGVRPGMSDHLVSEAVYLFDPDGLGIEVYVDRPRDEWRQENRQLVMATDPIDLESLLAAAGDAPWEGMPAGTVIGHVHLFVGEIGAASKFYHEGLGLDRTVWNYPGALFMSAGGYHHHLGTNTWATGARPAGPGDARLLEWELVVPTAADAAAALESVKAAGGLTEHSSAGGSAIDPWGTRVRLVARGR